MNLSSVDAVLTGAGVAFAYLFGSRATGRHRAGSDADVKIKVGRPLRLLEEVALAQALASVTSTSQAASLAAPLSAGRTHRNTRAALSV